MKKKELLEKLDKLMPSLETLNDALVVPDDKNDWSDPQIIARRKQIQTAIIRGNLFRQNQDNVNESVSISNVWKTRCLQYDLPQDISNEYWFRLTSEWIPWWLGLFDVQADDYENQRIIDDLISYGIAFGWVVLIKDNETYKVAIITEYLGNKKIKCIETQWLRTIPYEKKDTWKKEVEKHIFTTTLDNDCVEFEYYPDHIGEYVKLIPYLGRHIIIDWQKARNTNALNIVVSTQIGKEESASDSIAAKLMNPLSDELDTVGDPTTAYTTSSKRIEWLTPPQDIGEVFNILDNELKNHIEFYYNKFGRDSGSNDKQDLNKKVENQLNAYKPIQLYKLRKIERLVNQLNDFGLKCKSFVTDLIKEEHEPEPAPVNEGNSNASKQDETLSDKDENGMENFNG